MFLDVWSGPFFAPYSFFIPNIAQAKWKSNGEATIIRMTTPEGNMNPRFTEVDIEPDEDLNRKLKFYVSRGLALLWACPPLFGQQSMFTPATVPDQARFLSQVT